MISGPLTFGPITFNAPMDWTFFPRGEHIFGRPPTRVGVLTLSAEFRDAIEPRGASHEECWDIATRLCPPPDDVRFEDQERRFIDFLPYGAATFRNGDDLIRLWYRSTPHGLVVACFSTPNIRAEEAITAVSIEDCSAMVRSAKIAPPEA
ncbi:MAG TPA: hypothetical protein VL282_15700 [Tepidisphaeraceae bacterium]|jgi:hypothetical protein|nr:hypothetical protein [Tepidisphaeraceae bacterium]